MKRRLIKSGLGSYVVSVPIDWVRRNNLKKGDMIDVVDDENSVSLIPSGKEIIKQNKSITIDTTKKPIEEINNRIISAYLNNYSPIVISGKGLRISEIKETIHTLLALEIIEVAKDKIVARDFLDIRNISILGTIRRIDMMVRSILKDSRECFVDSRMYETIAERDINIDGQCFLVFKILKTAMTDNNVMRIIEMKNTDVMDTWKLTKELENIGDHSTRIGKKLNELKIKDVKSLEKLYSSVEKEYLRAIKSYFAKDKAEATKVIINKHNIMAECMEFSLKYNSRIITELIEEMKKIERSSVIVSRIVVDME